MRRDELAGVNEAVLRVRLPVVVVPSGEIRVLVSIDVTVSKSIESA